MRRCLRAFTVVFAAFALGGPFGCPVTHVDACEEQLRITCEFQFRCCDAEERLTGMLRAFPYIASEAECIERIAGYCKTLVAGNDDAVAAGRMRFDGARSQECLGALREARDSCDYQAFNEANSSTTDEPGPCSEISVGLVEEGEACASSAECADEGAVCEIDYEDPELNEELGTRDGECVGPGGVGDDCSERTCQDALVCVYDTETNAYTCQELPGLGEPCPAFQCEEGLGCGYDTATSENRCMEPAGLGESCATGGVCAEGLVCTYDPVTYEQTCENAPGIGEPCPSYACVEGAFCNDAASTPGTCEAQVAPGGECDPNVFDQCAGESSWCDDEQSPAVCVDYGAEEPVDDDICDGN